MHDTRSGQAKASAGFVQQVETYVQRCLQELEAKQERTGAGSDPKGPGRPLELPKVALWSSLLLCVLQRARSVCEVWRSVVLQGYDICDQTLSDRLEQEGTSWLEQFFAQITAMLAAWVGPLAKQQAWYPLASFATDVLALDETTLDPVARKLPILRYLKKGAVELLPGKLAGLYDVRFRVGVLTLTYLTNVLDPTQLPIQEIARLYARRWDIELAFLTLKEHLGLHLLWTSKLVSILQQVWACLIIAQVLQALRMEIACGAGVDPFEVSLPLVVQALAPMLARGEDVVALCVQRGRQLGLLRPSSRTRRQVPQVAAQDILPRPAELVLEREPRYPDAPGQPGRGRSKRQSGPPGLPKELTSAFYACLLS